MEATEKPNKKGQVGSVVTTCKPDNYTHLIGQDGAVLDNMELPPRTRILRPGMMRTMGYFEGRLNFYLDSDGKIDRISCG